MAETISLSKTASNGSTPSEILHYITSIYIDFINKYSIHIYFKDILNTITSKCFIAYKNKTSKYEVRMLDGISSYQIIFKTTSELGRMVNWKYHRDIIPPYDIIQKIQQVAIIELATPVRLFIQDKLRIYDPKFNSAESKCIYEKYLTYVINNAIFTGQDIANKRYYLIIRK